MVCCDHARIEEWREEALQLTHWGRVTHICVGNLTIIGSDNGLSPGRRLAITWTNVGILLIGPLGTNFSEMLIEIHTFSFKKIHLKMSSGKWQPFCLGLNVLMSCDFTTLLLQTNYSECWPKHMFVDEMLELVWESKSSMFWVPFQKCIWALNSKSS